ncbi:hypothetical protein D3C81_1577330 [compost metagenome]
MERGVPYVTDEGFDYYRGKNREYGAVLEGTLTAISPVWSQVVFTASGAISQPWYHKLIQIRKELHK